MSDKLCDYTTFGIGGKAKNLIVAHDLKTLLYCAPGAAVLGRGSNVLVSDRGYDGTVLINRYEGIDVSGCAVTAGSGMSLAKLCRSAAELGLTGLEFAVGIPGSVGGAVKMNAGAFGSSFSDVLVCADVLRDGNLVTLGADELGLGYRTSSIGDGDTVICATLALKRGNRAEIEALCARYRAERAKKQPHGRSAGSVFKNPVGMSVGALIESLGLKGLRIGGAEISRKHANIIVNTGGATASDVRELILTAKTALLGIGIEAHEEIEYIGEFD